jgi:hypothetical protein
LATVKPAITTQDDSLRLQYATDTVFIQ